jgi:preprotein translocase subunit SecY
MWLGEQISERGIGNGISLIIFAGIVVSFPAGLNGMIGGLRTGSMNPLTIIFLGALMVAVIAFIVFVERGQRRIPVSYAKRVVGRKVYGGQSTHLPLRVNTGGVIPIIFAASVITIPATMATLIKVPVIQTIAAQFGMGMPLYNLVYVAAIIFFTYFYISIIFNPVDVADNLRKYGGFIPGIRPGKNTSDYIDDVLSRITLAGAIYLAAVAILPEFLITGFRVQALPWIGPWLDANLPRFITQGMGVNFMFGGTSILIVVGVAMDTMQQIEAQLVMRHYDGFMRRSRIRGRRG